MMNRFLVLSLAALVLGGCATSQQKLERRKQEKSGAYSSLTAEQRTLVDQGQIATGLPMDAVYIAWGKPDQLVNSGTEAGTFTTWIYLGVYLQSYLTSGMAYGPYSNGPYGFYAGPRIDYYPVNYVSAEVRFQKGLVTSWQASPRTQR